MERDAGPGWLGPSYSRAPSEGQKIGRDRNQVLLFRRGAQGRQPARPQPTQAKSSGMRPFQDPSVKITTARERLSKLEAALAAMTGMDGPEVESLRVAHKRAQVAVQEVPVEAQVKECKAFLTRARSHLAELVSKRVTIMENIEASEKRLLELRTKMQAPPPTKVSEVQQLRELVSQLQAQVESLWGPSVDIHSPNPKRLCRREDFVPFCDEEFQEWMEGRRLANRCGNGTVLRSGEDFSVACASSVGVAAGDPRPSHVTPISSGQFCAVIRHRCGMLGVRVGEASNPGPPSLRRLRRNRSAVCAISSDEEPLIRGVGRNVVARVGEPEPTMLDSQDSFEDQSDHARPRVRRLHLISSQSVAPASSSPLRDCNRLAAVPHNFGRADVVHIGTPRQQVSRDSVVNALPQGPSSVGNARDNLGSTVVDSGQQANRFSPLTAEIEEEPLSSFRPHSCRV